MLNKKQFVSAINAIEAQYKHDNTCASLLKKVYPDGEILQYDNSKLNNAFIQLLQELLKDNHKHSWIEYYCFELDFGAKYKKGCAKYKDGTAINLSTAGKLYDFLIKEMEATSESNI